MIKKFEEYNGEYLSNSEYDEIELTDIGKYIKNDSDDYFFKKYKTGQEFITAFELELSDIVWRDINEDSPDTAEDILNLIKLVKMNKKHIHTLDTNHAGATILHHISAEYRSFLKSLLYVCINLGVDWNILSDGVTFMYILSSEGHDKIVDDIKQDYPSEYNKYIRTIKAKRFKLL